MLRDPGERFGEAWVDGRVEVRGDLLTALETVYRAMARHADDGAQLVRGHSPRAAREHARYHYDVGNDFYRLWLDAEMLYSCAFYPAPEATLEEAQAAKMERVCRKLALRRGERVVEAGCGWGALALHMARHHGVHVTAYNVSHEQLSWARERAWREGLAASVEFVEADYREIRGTFDAFVSVGMLEHVGPENLEHMGRVVNAVLDRNEGRGLLHFIGLDQPRALNGWIRRRIFPGAQPPTPGEVIRGVLEPSGLAVLHVENLRPHYARTLRDWRQRFEAAREAVVARYGAPFARTWQLYLAGSEAAFRTASLELYQVLFARPGVQTGFPESGEPWKRPTS